MRELLAKIREADATYVIGFVVAYAFLYVAMAVSG